MTAIDTTALLARFDGDNAKAVEWLQTERAQNAYIASNARHAKTVADADAQIVAINAAIKAISKKRLYALHLSHHVDGMVKGPVRAVDAAGMVFDLDMSGNCVVPDKGAVSACLPHYYRMAFSRAGISQISGQSGFHYTLYNARGKWMNTVYAIPTDV